MALAFGSATALSLGLPRPSTLVYHCSRPWFPTAPPLACHCPHPWSTKEGSMCPRPRVQESKQGPRAQVPKGPRSRRVQESKDPRVKGLNLLRIQGLQGSKGPGSRGLMVQGSRGTRGSTRIHEVPASRGPKDPRDRVQRTKGPKTQGSKDLAGPRVQRSNSLDSLRTPL